MPQDLAKQYQNYTCADMQKYAEGKQLSFDFDIEKAVKDYVQMHLLKDIRW
jgi:hypothetical protein